MLQDKYVEKIGKLIKAQTLVDNIKLGKLIETYYKFFLAEQERDDRDSNNGKWP